MRTIPLFFGCYSFVMFSDDTTYLDEVEESLKRRFNKDEADRRRLPSTAADAAASDRLDQLVLPDEMRARMPLTKDKFLVKENPHLVSWEREVRKFLRKLENAVAYV